MKWFRFLFIIIVLPTIAAASVTSTAQAKECCRVCKSSIPCGDSCISKKKICDKPKGCACSAAGKASVLGLLNDPPETLEATVIEIIDGDTIRARVKGWPRKIANARLRLKRIDTPEIRHAQCEGERATGEKAKTFVQSLLPLRSKITFVLDAKTTDSFGRYLVEVTLPSGRNLADTLVAAKFAVPYDGGEKPNWCI